MILSLICTMAMRAGGVEEFFPLVPGTRRIYQQKGGDGTQLENFVGKPLDMGGAQAIPVTETQAGQPPKTTYYKLGDGEVTIVAYDIKHPLPAAMPILKLGPGKVEWDFHGATQTGPQGERMLGHGEARSIGMKEVLGKKVDLVEVKLNTQVGSGMSSLIFEQKTIYGRGLGVVEMNTKVRLGKTKQTMETSIKLVSVEPPKSG